MVHSCEYYGPKQSSQQDYRYVLRTVDWLYISLFKIYGYSLSTVESNDEWNGCYTGVLTNVRHIVEAVPDENF
ncbi:MAG: hypothetical protein CM1200mP10_13510 [Candidatus Neomarinimicrobiota bacterium]|nr:MAG: hypothetical protein CM1200mP10_13510 [Candidatus Neomarinimicrobiota bacterium]